MTDQTPGARLKLSGHFDGESALNILSKAEEYEWDLLRKMQAKYRSIMEARAEQRRLLEQVINDLSPRTESSRSNREPQPTDSSEFLSRRQPHVNGGAENTWQDRSSVDQLSRDDDPIRAPSKRPKQSDEDAFKTPSKRTKQSNGFSDGSSATFLPGSDRALHGDMIKLYLNSPQKKRFKMYAYPDVPVAEVMEAIRDGGLEFDKATYQETPVDDAVGGNQRTLEDFGVRSGSTLDLRLSGDSMDGSTV
ncbi:hypothetical protein BJ742DRAFT_835484 [Cladochytrium replicatum]|nr:hypothetical protein BJ742DRAFT_835484 [Cladochytrium replicatum]